LTSFRRYRAYGLDIEAEMEIPQLLPGAGPGAVRIRLGSTPPELDSPLAQTAWHQQNESQCLIWVDGVARFLIERGALMVVDPDPNAHPQTVNLWLLGSAMAALLHQRGLLPIHASAVETPFGAVLIAGDSGAGKSTTAAGFLQRGCRLLADDVSAITLDAQGKAMVAPAYPQQKLWQDALDHLNISSDNLNPLLYYRTKYALPRLNRFCDTPLPVRALYLLAGCADSIQIRPVTGMAKLAVLSAHIYRPHFMLPHPHSIPAQTVLMALATQASVAQVQRPNDTAGIDALVDTLFRDLAR